MIWSICFLYPLFKWSTCIIIILLQGDKPPKAEEGAEKTEDLFEDNFKELKNWVEVKSSKFGTLLVLRERRYERFGTALKVFLFSSSLSLRNLSTLHHA